MALAEKRILIIGGTGVFGKRLVRHLALRKGIAVYVSSRDAIKARNFVQSLREPLCSLFPIQLDTQKNLSRTLKEINPFIVVDCSGPFQRQDYETALDVIKSGAHYIDLADARDFLADFADKLDGIAKERGVTALTGASSSPSLSTCVLKANTSGWQRIDTVDICITPGGRSEVGNSVIQAILSYAGSDVPIWLDGKIATLPGWLKGRAIQFPGLGKRRVAPVETYDAEYLGPTFGVQKRVSFSAGLESKIEQRSIEALAFLRKVGVLKSLAWLAPKLIFARKFTRITTSSSGGMMVKLTGLDDGGARIRTTWAVIAHHDHGPFIPVLPAAACIGKLLDGCCDVGADFAHTTLSLSDIENEMRPYHIITNTIWEQL